MMSGALSGGEKPKPGRPEKVWLDCVSDDLKVFQATSGSTEDSPPVFGVKTAPWPTAAKQWDRWYTGVIPGAERVHGGVAPTGRGEEVRAPYERGGARHKG